MRGSRLLVALVVFSFAVMAGCGGGSSNFSGGNPLPGSSQASLSITDNPPAGVTVMSFEVNVISASLSPGNVPLLNTPTEIEIKHLETEKAFLASLSVSPGHYTGLNLTLSGTELTILNSTGGPITAFGQTCNNGQVCEFKPNGPPINVSYTGAPFPLDIAANTPVGFLVDLNLMNIISSTLGIDFTVPNGVIVTQSTAPPTGELGKLDDLKGMVVSTDSPNNQFVLHTLAGDRTIKVDTSTVYKDFDEGNPPCTANPQNFSCLKPGQMLEVDLSLLGSGMLLAKKVELESHDQNEEGLEGIITSVDALNNKFNMVAVENFSALVNAVGSPMTVSVQTGATFEVQPGNVTVDPTLISGFTGGKINALMVGQSVRVHRLSGDGSTATPIVTDRVRLEASRFTATVAGAPTGNNFNVNGLPSLFTSQIPAINTIGVQTVPGQTEFEGFTPASIAGVAAGNLVSIRGLLFKTAGNPTVVASKLRKRS
jgi:hypothetical protein